MRISIYQVMGPTANATDRVASQMLRARDETAAILDRIALADPIPIELPTLEL